MPQPKQVGFFELSSSVFAVHQIWEVISTIIPSFLFNSQFFSNRYLWVRLITYHQVTCLLDNLFSQLTYCRPSMLNEGPIYVIKNRTFYQKDHLVRRLRQLCQRLQLWSSSRSCIRQCGRVGCGGSVTSEGLDIEWFLRLKYEVTTTRRNSLKLFMHL